MVSTRKPRDAPPFQIATRPFLGACFCEPRVSYRMNAKVGVMTGRCTGENRDWAPRPKPTRRFQLSLPSCPYSSQPAIFLLFWLAGGKPLVANKTSKWIHWAFLLGSWRSSGEFWICATICRAGADVNAVDMLNRSALHFCTNAGAVEVGRMTGNVRGQTYGGVASDISLVGCMFMMIEAWGR